MCGGRDCGVKQRHYGVEKFVKMCEGLYSGVETRVVMNGVK